MEGISSGRRWAGSERKQGNTRKTSTSVLSTSLKRLTVWIITNCGKLSKRWEYQTRLTCLLRNLYLGQEAIEPCMEQLIVSGLRKEYIRAVCCHPVYLIYVLSTPWEIPGWMSYKLKSKLEGENQQFQLCRWYHCNSRKWRGTKEPLDEGEGGEWKSWLKPEYEENWILRSWHLAPLLHGK